MDEEEDGDWAKKDPVFRLLVRNESDDCGQNTFHNALHFLTNRMSGTGH